MYPTPQDNPHNCPVCGYRPCSDDCRLGLTIWDLQQLDALFMDDFWSECDNGNPNGDDGD